MSREKAELRLIVSAESRTTASSCSYSRIAADWVVCGRVFESFQRPEGWWAVTSSLIDHEQLWR